ncbi:MAG: leucine-rich repeat protein [Acholeplasmatales bacterium]|nr:leucine-rich repeat protein [Acholeplasmatales bacterium]
MEEQNNIIKNMRKRSIMLMIGIIFIIFFNTLYFVINYIIKGNEVLYLFIHGSLLLAMYIYLGIYMKTERKNMYKSRYLAGQIIFVIPVFFYLLLVILDYVNWKIFNYESLAYSLISFILYFTTFRFNLRDKNPLKTNIRCIVAGVVGMVVLPIVLIAQAMSPRGFEITNFSRTLKYKVNSDDTLTVSGTYKGLSKKIDIDETYYTKKVVTIGTGAFTNVGNIKKITIDDCIKNIEEGAFKNLKKVTIEGNVTIDSGAFKNVDTLVLKSKDEKPNLTNSSFDGKYLFVDRKYVDEYRKEFGIDKYIIAPNVKKNEYYVTFEVSADKYIDTAIILKGTVLDPNLLTLSADTNKVLYNDTISYKNDNEYYKERYDNSLDVLPYWIDENGARVDFNEKLNKSVSIKPVYEKIKKYEVDHLLGDEAIEDIYVSYSREYVLPTINNKERIGFDKLTYTYDSQTVDKLVYDNSDINMVFAKWQLEAPVIETVSDGKSVNKIETTYDYDYDNNKSKENLINVNVTHKLSDSETGNVTYVCEWENNNKGVLSSYGDYENGQLSVSQVSDTGSYIVNVYLKYEEYGHTYYSEKIASNIEVIINKKETQLSADNIVVTYDNNIHEPVVVSSHPETNTEPTITYAKINGNQKLDLAPIDAGSYKAKIIYPETDNYLGASTESTIEIKKRLVNIDLYSNMKSVYGEALDSNYLNNSYTEGTNLENQGIVLGTTLDIALSGVGKNANSYRVKAISLNPNYDIKYDEVDYIIEKRTVNMTILDSNSIYGDNLSNLNCSYPEGSILEGDNPFVLITNANNLSAGEYVISCETRSNDYNIISTNGTYTVNPRTIKVVIDNKQSVYGNNLAPLTCNVTEGKIIGNDKPFEINCEGLSTTSNVGQYTILGQSTSDNYNIEFVNGTYEVLKRLVNVVWEDLEMTYDNVALSPKAYYLDLNNEKVYLSVNTNETTVNVGTYTVSINQLEDNNYELDENSLSKQFIINARNITLTIDNKSSVYGDELEELSALITDGSVCSGDLKPYTLSTNATNTSVGNYDIICTTTNDNYNITYNEATYEVTKRFVEVDIDSKSSMQDSQLEELTYIVVFGSFAFDDENNFSLTTTATSNSAPGQYEISFVYSGDNNNYSFTYNNATYTILERE